jgi:hypothetical protein
MPGLGGGIVKIVMVSIRDKKKMFRRKSYFERQNAVELSRESHDDALVFPNATPEILEDIQLSHARRKKRFGMLAALVVVCSGVLTINIILKNQSDVEAQKRVDIARGSIAQQRKNLKKQEDYLFYLTDGDYWFSQGHFKNAVYQYEMAQWFYPQGAAVQSRLNRTYLLACEREGLFCEKLNASIE